MTTFKIKSSMVFNFTVDSGNRMMDQIRRIVKIARSACVLRGSGIISECHSSVIDFAIFNQKNKKE